MAVDQCSSLRHTGAHPSRHLATPLHSVEALHSPACPESLEKWNEPTSHGEGFLLTSRYSTEGHLSLGMSAASGCCARTQFTTFGAACDQLRVIWSWVDARL